MKSLGHSSVEMFLRDRKVRAEKLDAAMQRLDAAMNTLITPASAALVSALRKLGEQESWCRSRDLNPDTREGARP
jgi:hypothetical protein